MAGLQSLTVTETQERRAEYAELWGDVGKAMIEDGIDVTITGEKAKEILATAIDGIDAIDRVIEFAQELEAQEGPVATVAHAFAAEIRRALKGQR